MPSEEEDRQALLDTAARLVGATPSALAVVIVEGVFTIVQPLIGVAVPGAMPEDMSEYDAAILRALTDRPLSSQQIARRAEHRHNSYFRRRLAVLVEGGQIRHTRRGYTRHGE